MDSSGNGECVHGGGSGLGACGSAGAVVSSAAVDLLTGREADSAELSSSSSIGMYSCLLSWEDGYLCAGFFLATHSLGMAEKYDSAPSVSALRSSKIKTNRVFLTIEDDSEVNGVMPMQASATLIRCE